MGIHRQVYFCEVSPCEYCGRQIEKGRKVYTDKQGQEFCSIDCLLSDAWFRHQRGGVIHQQFRQQEVCNGTH